MLAEIPVISAIFQGLLDTIGWILAWLYDVIPNYGVAIILLTLFLRFLLFPLGMKQIKSMQAMQALQPKIKEIQKKYKNNKQKAQEETMRLYKDAGVNPLGGCLPVLAQFPLLIAMYAVIRPPEYQPINAAGQDATQEQVVEGYKIENNHLPTDSALFASVVTHEGTGFLGLNLQCSAAQAGDVDKSTIRDSNKEVVEPGLPLLDAEGQPLDSFLSKPRVAVRHRRADVEDRLRAVARAHDRHRVLPDPADATGQPTRCGLVATADDPAGHAAVLRLHRLQLPGRPGALLDRLQPVHDRPADPAASGGPHRPRCARAAHGRAEGEDGSSRPTSRPRRGCCRA